MKTVMSNGMICHCHCFHLAPRSCVRKMVCFLLNCFWGKPFFKKLVWISLVQSPITFRDEGLLYLILFYFIQKATLRGIEYPLENKFSMSDFFIFPKPNVKTDSTTSKLLSTPSFICYAVYVYGWIKIDILNLVKTPKKVRYWKG